MKNLTIRLFTESLIAQTPLKDSNNSRLLVMDRETGEMKHLHFKDIIEYFRPGDTLVLNDTRVMPARLSFKRRNWCKS